MKILNEMELLRMRFIVCFIMLSFFCGCGEPSEEEILKKAEQIELARLSSTNNSIKIKKEEVISYHIDAFTKKPIINQPKEIVKTLEIDGCEYIYYENNVNTRRETGSLAHKGNCIFCLEKRKK